MVRRSCRKIALALPVVLAGCSSNPENDPVLAVGTVVAYAVFFGLFIFLLGRALFGPDGPD